MGILRHYISIILPACGMMMLILDSQTAMHGAAEGIVLCINSVVPSLFPFFVLSILLTNRVLNSHRQTKEKTALERNSNAVFVRSEADSNRCSSFCRAVPSHSAIRPYYPFGSANIQTFSFFTKFLPFFHRKVKISSLSHTKTSYREIIS